MYSKEWLKNLPVGTQFVFGTEKCDTYTLIEKKYKNKDKLQRYLSIPLSRELLNVYFDEREQILRMKYPEPNHDFPLEGRLQGIILPQ